MSVDWNGFFNKLPNTLNTLGAIASSIEQFSLARDPEWNAWQQYNRLNGDPSSIMASGIARMNNFTNAIISDGKSLSEASLFCDPKVRLQMNTLSNIDGSTTTNTSIDTNMNNTSDMLILNDSEWTELNNDYANLDIDQKETWETKYKDGLNKLAKVFTSKIKGSDASQDEKVSKEEFINYIIDKLKDLSSEYSAMDRENLEAIAETVWNNVNIGNEAEFLDIEELSAFLATLDEAEERDGKITNQELGKGISNLASGASEKVKEQHKRFFEA